MSDNAVVCHDLSKQFGTVAALDGVNLTLPSGQFLALLGPSGCGKTTLLRIVAGFEDADAGSIAIGGRAVFSAARSLPPEQRHVGMVFQDYALFPHLSVAQNVAYGLSRRSNRDQRVAHVLDLVGLAGLDRRMPHELSGGQQQRVALARALAPQPAVLLLDEPFSNLDASLRQTVRSEVREILQREGATVLFVTHDQEEALSLSDAVAVMFRGQVVQTATPRQLYQRPATREVAAFIGAANFLPGEADGMSVVCALGRLPLNTPAHGPVDVLIRPEMLALTPHEHGLHTVAQQTYFGHSQHVAIKLAGGQRLQAHVPPWIELVPDEQVIIAVREAVMVFPR